MTSRVHIAPIGLVYADAVQHLAEDPCIGATTNLPQPYPPKGAATWIRYMLPRQAAGVEYGFVVLDEADQVVGVNGFVDVSKSVGYAELGYWIGSPYWGQGYATEANRQLLTFGFENLGLKRIIARPLARNIASCRVLEKLGFRLLRTQVNLYPKFRPTDWLALYEMTDAMWETLDTREPHDETLEMSFESVGRFARMLMVGGLLLGMTWLAGCGKEQATDTSYEVVGKVTGKKGSLGLVVAHEDIPGFMDAMTMPFTAADSIELAGIQVGDSVRFRWVIGQQFSWIEEVEVTYKASLP